MSPEIKFIFFQLVIVGPFFLGFIGKKKFPELSGASKKMVTFNLAVLEPPIILWSIWGLSLTPEMAALPVFGLFMVVVGFFLGKIAAPLLDLSFKGRKTFVISASLANHGFTMGGFICYLISGETGLALSSIFLIYFIPFTFLFLFAYAGLDGKNRFSLKTVAGFFLTLKNMPLLAVLIALALNLMEVRRPLFVFPTDALLILSVGLYYLTLGITFEPVDLKPFERHHGVIAMEKFVVIPLLVSLVSGILPVTPEIKQVVLIQSFMPAAIYSVVTSIIFDLDSRLASSLFVVNSLLFILIVFPVLVWLGRSI